MFLWAGVSELMRVSNRCSAQPERIYGGGKARVSVYSHTMQRKIIHIDADCFYAAIEMRDNPELRGIPMAVGGSAERRGVLTTCNYDARAYGVRSAMPTAHALRLCPQLTVVPPQMHKYREASKVMRGIFANFTEVIEPL